MTTYITNIGLLATPWFEGRLAQCLADILGGSETAAQMALLVLVVASLTVVGTIVMIMIDKRDDAATLRMMGANRATVRDIFVGEGHLLAGVSLVLGVAAGVGLTLLQQTVGLVRLQTATLMVDIYPVELHAADVLLTAAAYIVVAHVVTRLTVGAMLKDNATI